MVAFHGQGHSAVIHTEDAAVAEAYGMRMKTARIIVNSPSSQGAIGGIYNGLLPSLTLGCGFSGSTSVSNNVSAAQLLNVKRVSARRNNLQWFRVPPKICFEPQAIRYLTSMPDVHEGVELPAAAVERLRDAAGIEPTFKALGVDERTFLDALSQQALNAYEDQCAPASPRMPMLDDMRGLMRTAYYG